MSMKWGTAGSFVVGGSHINWAETTITLVTKAINPDVLQSVLNSAALNQNLENNIEPIAVLYAEDVSTKNRTEIPGLANFTIRNNKRSPKGTYQLTVVDAITTNTRTTAYADMLDPKNDYYLVLEAGYRVDGSDYLTPILKGVKQVVTENYGRRRNSINISGFDLTDNLERVDGIYSSYSGSCKTLIAQVLNEAGFQGYDLRFTDFNFTSQDFNYDNGLQLIQGIVKRFGTLQYYVEGDGTFVMTEPSAAISYDYEYTSDQNIFTLSYEDNVSDRVNTVEVSGQGIYIERQATSDIDDYGLRKGDLQSNLIQTQAQAEAAADEVITDSFKRLIRFMIPFNPYILVDTVLRITHTGAGISEQLIRVAGMTHVFSTTENSLSFKTQITAELIESGAPTIVTTEVL